MQKAGSVGDSTKRPARSKAAEQALSPGRLLPERDCPLAFSPTQQSRLPLPAGTLWPITGALGQVSEVEWQ